MASLLGFLGALGDSMGIGSPDQPNALTRLNNDADPVAAAQRQEAMAQQSALAALANNRQQGITNPLQNLNTVGQYLPEYTLQAAKEQAQNPLANILQQNTGQNTGGGVPGAPAPGGQVGPTQPKAPTLADLSGPDLLKALPPAISSQVQGLVDGKINLSSFALKQPYWQQMLTLASQVDPNFDMANYPARQATRKDFTSGKSAQNITALNTAMGHLSSLSDAYNNLGNTDYPTYNAVANYLGNEFGNNKIQTNTAKVGADSHAVAEELAKVFRSSGMAESDVKAWENKIGTSTTPAQSKAVIGEAIDLMNSRLDSLGQQYNQGMGTTKNGIELLSPKAQAAYQKLNGIAPSETKASGNLAVDNAQAQSQAQNAPDLSKLSTQDLLKRLKK